MHSLVVVHEVKKTNLFVCVSKFTMPGVACVSPCTELGSQVVAQNCHKNERCCTVYSKVDICEAGQGLTDAKRAIDARMSGTVKM